VVVGLLASLSAAGCTNNIEAGHQLYMKHGCATCHGATGRGDGPSAPRLVVPPTDFANAEAYREGSSPADIATTIRYGTGSPGPMPPFAHISEEDAALLAAWIVSLQGSDVTVRDAWLRESTESRTVSSGYLTIENRGTEDLSLIGVAVDGVGRAELHAVVEDGYAVMRRVESLKIPAGSSVALEPGGTHVMLFDIKPPLVVGNPATVTLSFDNNRKETVRAVVRPLAAMSVR
jgi:periplasmic copper chaperone A